MATWTNVANTSLEPGSPARSVDAFALRDNPIAIAEGAAGAPRIETNALTANEQMTTANVLARTAGAGLGAVGTYVYAFTTLSFRVAGSTVGASNLRYFGTGAGGPSAGTWRAMGSGPTNDLALWLRIS